MEIPTTERLVLPVNDLQNKDSWHRKHMTSPVHDLLGEDDGRPFVIRMGARLRPKGAPAWYLLND